MAMPDHLLRFRQKTTEELQALQAKLEARADGFSSQSMGTKNYAKDLRNIDDQLNAIAFVIRERGGVVIQKTQTNYGKGVTDFSCQPA